MADRYDPMTLLHYVEGDLPAEERAQFEATLTRDSHLRQLVSDMQADRTGLRQLPREDAPSHLVEDAVGHLERQMLLGETESEPEASGKEPEARRFHLRKTLTYAAIAAVVVISGGVVIQSIYDINVIEQTRKWSMSTPVVEQDASPDTSLAQADQDEIDAITTTQPGETLSMAMADADRESQPLEESLRSGRTEPLTDETPSDPPRLAMAEGHRIKSSEPGPGTSSSEIMAKQVESVARSSVPDAEIQQQEKGTSSANMTMTSKEETSDTLALSITGEDRKSGNEAAFAEVDGTASLAASPKLPVKSEMEEMSTSKQQQAMTKEAESIMETAASGPVRTAAVQVNITTRDSEKTHEDLLKWSTHNKSPVVDERMALSIRMAKRDNTDQTDDQGGSDYDIVGRQRELMLQMTEKQVPELLSYINSRTYQNAALSQATDDKSRADNQARGVSWRQLLQSQLPLARNQDSPPPSESPVNVLVPVIISEEVGE